MVLFYVINIHMVLSKSPRFNSQTCCLGRWKRFDKTLGHNETLPKFISLPGSYRPLIINPQSSPDISLANALLKSNQFKAKPIKHWRKQYDNYNNRQSYHNRKLIQQYNTPGGYMVQTGRAKDNYNNPCECSGNVLGFSNYTLGEYNNSNIIKDSESSFDYTTCKEISNCILNDVPSKAKRKIRSTYNVPCTLNSYFSYYQYNHARCKEYEQNMNGDLSYGSITNTSYCSCGLDSSCGLNSSSIYGCCCRPENAPQSCRKRAWTKPNNKKFWQQGAVSSSSRLLRLKVNTLSTAANSIGVEYGEGAANALTYTGNPTAPFITKSKMNAGGYAIRNRPRASKYPVDADLYYRYLVNKKLWGGQNVCVKNCL